MAWKKNPVTLPADLEAELEKVRKAAPPPPSSDDPIYNYLQRVYRLRRKLATSPELQQAIIDVDAALRLTKSIIYTRVIIELTAPHVSTKMKYKYVTVLQYALKEGVKANDFVEFVKKRGGLNKCVDRWSQKYGRAAGQKPAKKKSAKRLGLALAK